MSILLPTQAVPFFGPTKANGWGGVPWNVARTVALRLEGLWGGSLSVITNTIIYSSVANIDTDGPGGSRAVDPYWQPRTSLLTASGQSVDSRAFPGVVVPPYLTRIEGVRKGDFGLCCYAGRVRAFQVYDVGPSNKVGEVSIFLGRQTLVVAPSLSDRQAARGDDNNVKDFCTLIFRGSGPGHAVDPQIIAESADHLWSQFTGQSISVLA